MKAMKVNIYTDANVSKFSIVSHCSLEEISLTVNCPTAKDSLELLKKCEIMT
jgi:hypothetical protein